MQGLWAKQMPLMTNKPCMSLRNHMTPCTTGVRTLSTQLAGRRSSTSATSVQNASSARAGENTTSSSPATRVSPARAAPLRSRLLYCSYACAQTWAESHIIRRTRRAHQPHAHHPQVKPAVLLVRLHTDTGVGRISKQASMKPATRVSPACAAPLRSTPLNCSYACAQTRP